MMRRIYLVFFLTLLSSLSVLSQEMSLDTVMTRMRENAKVYFADSPDYEAVMYTKGTTEPVKRNFLSKMIPKYYRVVRDSMAGNFEMMSDLTFTNPDSFSQRIMDISYDNEILKQLMTQILFPFVHGNIYSPMMFGMIYSPLAPKSKRYYTFSLDSTWTSSGLTFVRVGFKRKMESYKLVTGYMEINTANWSVRRLCFEGVMEFMDYSSDVMMGEIGTNSEFMTTSIDFVARYHYLGNKFIGRYSSVMRYYKMMDAATKKKRGKEKDKYDLSVLYTTTYDYAVQPLAPIEQKRDADTVKKELSEKELRKKKSMESMSKVGEFLVSDNSVNMSKTGKLVFSPIISPVLFGYSSTEGISYAQKITYNKIFSRHKSLTLSPKIGYNFKEKSFHWYFVGNYVYNPRRDARVLLDFNSGDRIYTDEIENDLNSLPEKVFDPDKLNLKNFRSTYLKVGWGHEIVNGFRCDLIVGLYNYTAVPKSDFVVVDPSSQYLEQAKVIARNSYSSFVPEVRLQWTPCQYYYYRGDRKINLYSAFPTLSMSWAYSIKGALNSNMEYQRIEVDLYHNLDLGPLTELSYRVGFGGFFNYEKLYFSDFWNFRRNNLPQGWDDEIGGTFQLLDSKRYNMITNYARGHIRLDVPFILTTTILRDFPLILRERLYLNALFTREMPTYFELGYGLGTYMLDIGVFWGGEIKTPNKFGVKITFNFH